MAGWAGSAAGAVTGAVRETASGLPRQFWWMWTSTLINSLGGFVVTFLALYLTAHRGYSASYAGLVAALFGLGGAVGAVLGGVLADRVGRRPTMLAAQLATAAATVALGLATGPVTIAACAAVAGLANSTSRPAVQAMIADIVGPADRVRAFALTYWAINIGFGVSAAAAGFIAAQGYLWLFLGDAFATLVCACVVFAKVGETLPGSPGPSGRTLPGTPARSAKTPPGSPSPGRPAPTGTTGEAATLLHVLRDRRFMSLVLLTLLLGSVTQQGNSTLAVDMGAHGLSPREFGLVIAINGLVIVLLQIPVTHLLRKRPAGLLLLAGSFLLAWGFGLTAFAGSVGFYALTVVVWTLGEIVHAPASMSVVAELAPATARGRYQGMYTLSWSAAAFVGPLAGGLTLDHLGRGTTWGLCAVAGTAAGVGYWLLLRPGTAKARTTVQIPAPAPAPAAAAPVTGPVTEPVPVPVPVAEAVTEAAPTPPTSQPS